MITPQKLSPWRRQRVEKSHALGPVKFILYWSVLPFTGGLTLLATIIFLIKGSVLSVSGTILVLLAVAAVLAVFSTVLGWMLWLNVDATYDAIAAEKAGAAASETSPGSVLAKKAKADRAGLILVAGVLTVRLLVALFSGREGPGSPAQLSHTAIDLVLISSMVTYGVRLLRSAQPGRASSAAILTVGSFAALGLLVVRTGGGPRLEFPAQPQHTPDPQIARDMQDLMKDTEPLRQMLAQLDAMKKQDEAQRDLVSLRNRLAPQIERVRTSWNDLQQTKWIQTAPALRSAKLTRENVSDYRKRLGEVGRAIDQVIAAMAATTDVPVPEAETQYWQWAKESCQLRQEQANLIIANWKSWHSRGHEPNGGEPGFWQGELMRLDNEVEALTAKQTSAPTKLFP